MSIRPAAGPVFLFPVSLAFWSSFLLSVFLSRLRHCFPLRARVPSWHLTEAVARCPMRAKGGQRAGTLCGANYVFEGRGSPAPHSPELVCLYGCSIYTLVVFRFFLCCWDVLLGLASGHREDGIRRFGAYTQWQCHACAHLQTVIDRHMAFWKGGTIRTPKGVRGLRARWSSSFAVYFTGYYLLLLVVYFFCFSFFRFSFWIVDVVGAWDGCFAAA